MKKMTPMEREDAMIEGGTPDRIPVWQLNGIVAAQCLGYQWKDVRFDAKLSVEIYSKFIRMCGSDYYSPGCIETNATVMDLPGVEVKLSDNNYANVMSHYFNEPEDVDKKPLLDPHNKKETKWLWKGILDKVALAAEKEKALKEYNVEFATWGIMTTAGYFRNVETLMMDVILEPELAHKVMEKASQHVDGIIRCAYESGAKATLIADPSSSGSLISEEIFREFETPRMKKMIKGHKKDFGAPSYIHVCGESLEVAKPISELGAVMFSFDFMNKIKDIRALTGDKIILAGNLDPMNVMWNGTPESVMAASKKCIEDAEGKKYVLTGGCETPRDAPLENLKAMAAASEKYGRCK